MCAMYICLSINIDLCIHEWDRTLSDDVVNLTSEKYDPNAQMNHLHKRRKQKDLAEGTGVVPAKYLPKVKLEIFSQL